MNIGEVFARKLCSYSASLPHLDLGRKHETELIVHFVAR